MTTNTQFKTLMHEWLKAKKPMVAPSTYAAFMLIAYNHLIPHFGKDKIFSISEADVQSYILKLHESGRLDGNGGVGVKTIHDIILVFRLAMEYAYKARIIPLLNWLLIEYLKPDSLHHVSALSHDQERELI